VIVGTIGAADRRDYTTVGDGVTVAARLCALAGAGEIVTDAATARESGLAGDAHPAPAALKGRRSAIDVVRLRPPAADG
jgi:adenylate cyclase